MSGTEAKNGDRYGFPVEGKSPRPQPCKGNRADSEKHGALSVSVGNCWGGAYAGQIFTAIRFADWEAYGKTMQALAADADYRRLYAEACKAFELLERSVLEAEDL